VDTPVPVGRPQKRIRASSSGTGGTFRSEVGYHPLEVVEEFVVGQLLGTGGRCVI